MKSIHTLVLVVVLPLGVSLGIYARGGAGIVTQATSIARAGGLNTTTPLAPAGPIRAVSTGQGTKESAGERHVLIELGPEPAITFNTLGIFVCPESGECRPDTEPVGQPFTVQAVRYHQVAQADPIDPTRFNVVCVDHDPNGDDIPTCSPLEREPLGLTFPNLAFGGLIGMRAGVSAVVDVDLAAKLPVNISTSLAWDVHRRLRYPFFPQPTTDSEKFGGNVLIDSGVGPILAHTSVVISHENFRGALQILATKQVGTRLVVALLGSAHAWCVNDDVAYDPVPCTNDSPDCDAYGGVCEFPGTRYCAGTDPPVPCENDSPDCDEYGGVCNVPAQTGGAYCEGRSPLDFFETCPDELAKWLETACEIGNPNSDCNSSPTGAASAGQVAADEPEAFDIQEFIDFLNANDQSIRDVSSEIKARLKEKILDVFDLMREFLDTKGNAAGEQESVILHELKSLLRERIPEDLEKVKDIVRETISCNP